VRDPSERRRAFRLGLDAEAKAAWLLRLKGYRILARRLKTPRGEADLVAGRGAVVAFVEVKARDTVEAATEAVALRQRRRIVAAAEAWLARNPRYATATLRFDLVAVAPRRWPRHIENAFEGR
jgi:putative endonuclease